MLLKITDIFRHQKQKKQENLFGLRECLRFKTFHGNIDSVYYDDLDNYVYNYDFADDDEYRKIGSIRTLFKKFDKDYYKPIRTNDSFVRRKNNYIEYKSKGDRYENLSPKEYLKMIRPYLRGLIYEHKPIDDDGGDDDDTDRAKQKIQLVIQNSCISAKSFEETRTIYSKSKPVEIFMGSDTEDVNNTLFNTLLQRFQHTQETSNNKGSEFIPESGELLHYHFQKVDITSESYIMSPDQIVNKKATINPKNERHNKCFQQSVISGLNYNKIKEKQLKQILKFKRVDADFSSHQRDWEEFEQYNTLIALNILFVSYNSEEIKLAYKSNYNKRKNQVILLMINDEANNCYYFAVKNLSELYSLGWLRSKKEAIINGNNDFQNALDDSLNYQNIERHPQRISKLRPYINKYNWEGIEFPAKTETIRVAYRSEYTTNVKNG